jgi:hypothetical protein
MSNNILFRSNLALVQERLYKKISLEVSESSEDSESQDYGAGEFKLATKIIKQRTAKITPTKIGQFVTLWKRNSEGITQAHEELDKFDYFVINVQNKNLFGQFVFSKEVLISNGIVQTKLKPGKRGIRVYPSWDKPTSKQALKTQAWQLKYFLDLSGASKIDFEQVRSMYGLG